GQSIACRPQATGDERRKFPPEHEDAHRSDLTRYSDGLIQSRLIERRLIKRNFAKSELEIGGRLEHGRPESKARAEHKAAAGGRVASGPINHRTSERTTSVDDAATGAPTTCRRAENACIPSLVSQQRHFRLHTCSLPSLCCQYPRHGLSSFPERGQQLPSLQAQR